MQVLSNLSLFKEERKEIMDFISKNDLCASSLDYDRLVLPFEITSEDFIDFARTNIEENTTKSLVNALSNIKRSIDCRVASILYGFGLYKAVKASKWNFPTSADFLCKVDVLAPNILKTINGKRNELKHDFRKPKEKEVLGFLDIASLFFESTRCFMKSNWEIEITQRDESFPWLNVKLISEFEKIELSYWLGHNNGKQFTILSNEWDYVYFLDMIIRSIKNW